MRAITEFKDIHTHNLDAGEDAIINLPWGTHVPESGYYSVGIHPWDAGKVSDDDFDRLFDYAQNDRIVAIGETGLDALRGPSLADQERVFIKHIKISEKVGKPVIIHAVRTFHDIIRLRKKLRPAQRWIIHGFRGKPALARQLIDAGIDISLGKIYNPETLAVVPPEHLFRDTD